MLLCFGFPSSVVQVPVMQGTFTGHSPRPLAASQPFFLGPRQSNLEATFRRVAPHTAPVFWVCSPTVSFFVAPHFPDRVGCPQTSEKSEKSLRATRQQASPRTKRRRRIHFKDTNPTAIFQNPTPHSRQAVISKSWPKFRRMRRLSRYRSRRWYEQPPSPPQRAQAPLWLAMAGREQAPILWTMD